MENGKNKRFGIIFGIRNKLLLFFVLLVFISSAINVVFVRYSTNKTLTSDLLEKSVVATKGLAANLTDPVISKDKGKIVDLIFNEKAVHKDISYIAVIDENNNLTAGTFIGENPENVLGEHFIPSEKEEDVKLVKLGKGEEVYDIAARMLYGKGILRVGYFKNYIDKTSDKTIYFLAFGFFLSFLASIFFAFLFSSAILKPINEFKNIASIVAEGDLRKRADIKSGDEIGYLAKIFNKMLDSIEKKNRKMKEEQGEMKAVISSIGEGLFALDKDFKVVLMNKAAEKLLGVSEKSVTGKNIGKFLSVYKGKQKLPYKEWPSVKMLESGKTVNINVVDNIYYKNVYGKIFPVEITTAPFIRNGLKGVIVIFKDITELKAIEEEREYSRRNLENALKSIYIERDNVQEEKNKLTAILNSIGDAVMAVDENKKVMIFNQAAEKITGFSFSELKGRKYDVFLKFICDAEDRDKTDFIDILAVDKMKCSGNNISLLAKEKHLVSIDITAATIKDHNGEGMGHIVVFRDVTEKRETERMRSDFISLVSHQLRTPLASMKWFLEILLNGDVGRLKPKQADVVRETYDNNQNMIDFINQMLNVSRIESNRLAIVPVSLNVNDTVKNIISETMPLLEGKKQKLKFTGLKERSLEIKTDKNLLRNIVNSLITNASRYTPDKGKIAIEITKKEKGFLLFKVSDNGIGIPKKEQVKIFKKFSRASNAIIYEANGTGLGLYIVRSILDMMGGKIWFESKEGQGTTFFFLLPIDSIFCEINSRPNKKQSLK